jgi:hypothetical protein
MALHPPSALLQIVQDQRLLWDRESKVEEISGRGEEVHELGIDERAYCSVDWEPLVTSYLAHDVPKLESTHT